MSFSSGTFSIPHCPTYPAMPATSIQVEILSTKKMTALATFLRPFLFRVNLSGPLLGRLVVVLSSRIKQFFSRPVLRNSVTKSPRLDSVFLGQFRNVVSNSVNYHESSSSGISRLLASAGPLAIGWLVVSIRVNSIKRVTGRAVAYVSKKIIKRCQPAVAHLYASPTIVVKSDGSGGAATDDHQCPSSVERVLVIRHLRILSSRGIAGV